MKIDLRKVALGMGLKRKEKVKWELQFPCKVLAVFTEQPPFQCLMTEGPINKHYTRPNRNLIAEETAHTQTVKVSI